MFADLRGDRPDINGLGDLRLESRLPGDPDVAFYRALDTGDKPRLLKRLAPSQRFDATRKFLFESEKDLGQSLDHPAFVRWVDCRRADGEVLQIFDWAGDCSLLQILATLRYLKRRVDPVVAAYMFGQVLDALEYFREVTRSIDMELPRPELSLRPSLIRVSKGGDLVLTDFRIGSLPSPVFSRLYPEDLSLNFYAAPEQCASGRKPDHRVAFHNLGVLAFELFTGRPLFASNQRIELLLINRRKVRGLHPRASDVYPDLAILDEMIVGLLQPLPEKRTSDIEQIRRSLHRITPEPIAGRDAVAALVSQWNTLRENILSGMHDQAQREQYRLTQID